MRITRVSEGVYGIYSSTASDSAPATNAEPERVASEPPEAASAVRPAAHPPKEILERLVGPLRRAEGARTRWVLEKGSDYTTLKAMSNYVQGKAAIVKATPEHLQYLQSYREAADFLRRLRGPEPGRTFLGNRLGALEAERVALQTEVDRADRELALRLRGPQLGRELAALAPAQRFEVIAEIARVISGASESAATFRELLREGIEGRGPLGDLRRVFERAETAGVLKAMQTGTKMSGKFLELLEKARGVFERSLILFDRVADQQAFAGALERLSRGSLHISSGALALAEATVAAVRLYRGEGNEKDWVTVAKGLATGSGYAAELARTTGTLAQGFLKSAKVLAVASEVLDIANDNLHNSSPVRSIGHLLATSGAAATVASIWCAPLAVPALIANLVGNLIKWLTEEKKLDPIEGLMVRQGLIEPPDWYKEN
jgi:hypothetical protein